MLGDDCRLALDTFNALCDCNGRAVMRTIWRTLHAVVAAAFLGGVVAAIIVFALFSLACVVAALR